MKNLRIFLIALLGLAASSAMSQQVRFNFDESADFMKFKTYKWVTIEGVVQAEGLSKEQIEAAFDSELAKKGLAKVDTTMPTYLSHINSQSTIKNSIPLPQTCSTR
jgi:Domain of unknown function (DUF4136)